MWTIHGTRRRSRFFHCGVEDVWSNLNFRDGIRPMIVFISGAPLPLSAQRQQMGSCLTDGRIVRDVPFYMKTS
jgi:hypothetical protein